MTRITGSLRNRRTLYAPAVAALARSFNPLDRVELGRSVGRALLVGPCEPLPPDTAFPGAGIYAVYYQGDFEIYSPIAFEDCAWPIYVGRALPPGGRRGLLGLDADPGRKLYDRLRQHAKSVDAASNLDVNDFRCRYLVVDDIWIPLAERLLIGHYRPLWNGVVEGFGIHDPGGRPGGMTSRAGQQKSAWDTLHPGRRFARGRAANRLSKAAIRRSILEHLAAYPPRPEQLPTLGEPPATDDEVLDEGD